MYKELGFTKTAMTRALLLRAADIAEDIAPILKRKGKRLEGHRLRDKRVRAQDLQAYAYKMDNQAIKFRTAANKK